MKFYICITAGKRDEKGRLLSFKMMGEDNRRKVYSSDCDKDIEELVALSGIFSGYHMIYIEEVPLDDIIPF